MNDAQVQELLYQALETEIGGQKVYETAIRCAQNPDLKKEWNKYLDETRNHEVILRETFARIGLDTEKETPGRAVVRHKGEALVAAMKMALDAGGRGAAQLVAAESVVEAETKDHQNWELIGEVAKDLKGEKKAALTGCPLAGRGRGRPAPLPHDGLGSRALDRVARDAGRPASARGGEEGQDGHRRLPRQAGPRGDALAGPSADRSLTLLAKSLSLK